MKTWVRFSTNMIDWLTVKDLGVDIQMSEFKIIFNLDY